MDSGLAYSKTFVMENFFVIENSRPDGGKSVGNVENETNCRHGINSRQDVKKLTDNGLGCSLCTRRDCAKITVTSCLPFCPFSTLRKELNRRNYATHYAP